MADKKKKEIIGLLNRELTEPEIFQKQITLLMAVLLLFSLLYVLRLWHLQVLQGSSYRYQSENNRIRLEDIPAPRGIIYDRNGVALVENRPAYHVLLIREDVQDLNGTLAELARLLGRNVEELQAVINSHRTTPRFLPIRIAADLDRDTLARVEAQRIRLPGVVIQLEPKREYITNGSAAHLIGYLSEITEGELKAETYQGYYAGEDVGKFGVEGAFEKYLHGRRGGRQVEVDAVGRRMRLLDEALPIPGRNLWLTIDLEVQKVAEECLLGKKGAVVAVDPTNGAIIAMASTPTFDQEKFIRGISRDDWQTVIKDPDHPLLNRCIGASFPPGSTYKPFVALAGLKEGMITPETNFSCPGYLQFATRKYRCWRDRGHGSVEVERALIQSCDVFFYQTGLRLGVDRIAYWSKMFGLGERPGLGFTGENAGLIPTSAWKKKATGIPWQKGENLSIAIGQGFDLASPLQMAMGYAAIANGGKVWEPFVVRRIEGSTAEESSDIQGHLRRVVPIEQRYFDIVRKGLLGVVQDDRGTAHQVRDKVTLLAGKTGTAQVVRLGDGVNRKLVEKMAKAKDRDHAWFVGYAPANDPKIAVAAFVENGGHGSSVTAPIAQRVAAAYLTGQTTPPQDREQQSAQPAPQQAPNPASPAGAEVSTTPAPQRAAGPSRGRASGTLSAPGATGRQPGAALPPAKPAVNPRTVLKPAQPGPATPQPAAPARPAAQPPGKPPQPGSGGVQPTPGPPQVSPAKPAPPASGEAPSHVKPPSGRPALPGAVNPQNAPVAPGAGNSPPPPSQGKAKHATGLPTSSTGRQMKAGSTPGAAIKPAGVATQQGRSSPAPAGNQPGSMAPVQVQTP